MTTRVLVFLTKGYRFHPWRTQKYRSSAKNNSSQTSLFQKDMPDFKADKKRNPNPGIKRINKQLSDTFKGIDKIRDNKNDEDFYAKFSMKPVAQGPRPAAYYLQEPLKKWLEQCLKEGIFEQVLEGQPVTWCSPLGAQPKPKFCGTAKKEDLEPHMIRASIDLRTPNQ